MFALRPSSYCHSLQASKQIQIVFIEDHSKIPALPSVSSWNLGTSCLLGPLERRRCRSAWPCTSPHLPETCSAGNRLSSLELRKISGIHRVRLVFKNLLYKDRDQTAAQLLYYPVSNFFFYIFWCMASSSMWNQRLTSSFIFRADGTSWRMPALLKRKQTTSCLVIIELVETKG